mmetsp:Transcript_45837/g.85692  ORF Transcript_45837/g.85692 Transcript_45837/m.85692 type:complete len:427 (-) Transcript_45837:26-1306(-)
MFLRTVLAFIAHLVWVWASSDLDGHCDPDDAVSFLQTQRNKVMLQDHAPAGIELQQDELSSLKAPPEGGAFSAFFNNHTEGPVVQKWLQYFPAYRRHLGKFIGRRELHVVQVGAASGGSLEMWRRVFGPGAHVYGVDLNPECKKYEDSRTKIFIGDQQNKSFWEDVVKQVPQIDILIDDGGHLKVEQQIATLGIMLPHLSPDGIYMTEDVNGFDNPFWQNLEFEHLSSPEGQQYIGLGSFISSVHIYPYLLVLEMQKNRGTDAMIRQLGTAPSEQPSETHTAVAGTGVDSQRASSHMQLSLRRAFPWLRWNNEKISVDGGMEPLVEELLPKGWLFLRDPQAHFSFEAPWDAQADTFLKQTLSDFQHLHDGHCCSPRLNEMQKKVDSLHIYPHLLVAQRTGSRSRLIKAPQRGMVPLLPGMNQATRN